MNTHALPDTSPLIAYYGDDLTGSTAVMEATAFAGLETVLFLDPPDAQRMADFPHARVIGIAGDARARSPHWMQAHLPACFAALAQSGAPILHYKVCSTFDSAPHIGSIGAAADIAAQHFEGVFPMVVGDLGMGRYQCFGHLFALSHGVPYRIDRHPVMARHPITPMDEADLTLHLQKQTDLPIGLIDFVTLHRGQAAELWQKRIRDGARILSLDVVDHQSLVEVGKLIWEQSKAQRFCIGSQGLESALIAYWQDREWIDLLPPPPPAHACDQILAVSGSVSPVTAVQIAQARAQGFATLPLDLAQLTEPNEHAAFCAKLYHHALEALQKGQDVLITSAEGPDGHAVTDFKQVLDRQATDADQLNHTIGTTLGHLADRLLSAHPLQRLVISGGDTSGRVARTLGIDALTALAPMAPGAPLCRAHCQNASHHGLEVLLKGGQVGGPDIFTRAKTGRV